MELHSFITTTKLHNLKEVKKADSLVDKILDKINKVGIQDLSFDERNYLKQLNSIEDNNELESWLSNEDDHTFDERGNKLLFDEFENDENIFYNHEKLKRVISKLLNQNPFTNNADWGGALVWGVKTDDNFTGIFIYLGDDDDLVLLKRNLNEVDDYEDEVLKTITTNKELNRVMLKIKKSSIF